MSSNLLSEIKQAPPLAALVAINAAILGLWHSTPAFSWTRRCHQVLSNHFTLSLSNIRDRQLYHNLITYTLNHYDPVQLLANTMALWHPSLVLSRLAGQVEYWALYGSSAIISGVSSLFWELYGEKRRPSKPQETNRAGATGVAAAVMTVVALACPESVRIRYFGLIDVSARRAIWFWLAQHLYAEYLSTGTVDPGSYVGGLVTGASYYFLFLRQRLSRSRFSWDSQSWQSLSSQMKKGLDVIDSAVRPQLGSIIELGKSTYGRL